MTGLDFDRIETAAKNASVGEWRAVVDPSGGLSIATPEFSHSANQREVDAAFVSVANPQAVLALVQRVREAEDAAGDWRERAETAESENGRLYDSVHAPGGLIERMSTVERTVRYATSVDDLSEAWVFVMARIDSVGPDPSVKINPFWSSSDDFTSRRFSVVVEGMQPEEES